MPATKKKMSKTRFRRLKKIIADRNRRFEKMTPAQQRVAIAKDVIASLEGKGIVSLTPKNGTYFQTANKTEVTGRGNDQLQDAFLAEGSCTVCAKGALFVAAVMRHDKLTFNTAMNRHENFELEPASFYSLDESMMKDYMGSFFSPRQWQEIELVFEDGKTFGVTNCYRYEISQKHRKPKDRMIAIMENIIKNKGEFIIK